MAQHRDGEDTMVAQQLDRDDEVRRAALPIALAVGAILGVLLWKLRKGERADRPIIMTGGSFHVWRASAPLSYQGRIGRTHIYKNDGATRLRKVVVKCGSEKLTYWDVSSLEIRYGSSSGDPNIVLRGGTLSIETDSPDQPLIDRGAGMVVDPDTDRPVTARHQEWTAPGEIMHIYICCGPKGVVWAPECLYGIRPRIKVYTA
jgi:hypothetical protein